LKALIQPIAPAATSTARPLINPPQAPMRNIGRWQMLHRTAPRNNDATCGPGQINSRHRHTRRTFCNPSAPTRINSGHTMHPDVRNPGFNSLHSQGFGKLGTRNQKQSVGPHRHGGKRRITRIPVSVCNTRMNTRNPIPLFYKFIKNRITGLVRSGNSRNCQMSKVQKPAYILLIGAVHTSNANKFLVLNGTTRT